MQCSSSAGKKLSTCPFSNDSAIKTGSIPTTMSGRLVETLTILEGYPPHLRIQAVDAIYFKYMEENYITVGARLIDTNDAFLLGLAAYRMLCIGKTYPKSKL